MQLVPHLFPILLFMIDSSIGQREYELTILHTNDVHSRFSSVNKHRSPCEEKDLKANQCWGGAARRMTAIKKFRNDDGPNVILLDAGDQFQGSVWYRTLKWKPISSAMNLMGYDAMALGNHEFDDGLDGLIPFLADLAFPIVNSNIKDNGGSLERFLHKWIILERGGERIGIVGCTTSDKSAMKHQDPQLIFNDEISSLQPIVDELTGNGVNKIIVLSHSGIDMDGLICKNMNGVDIVIGGHSHTFLWSTPPAPPKQDKPEGQYPEEHKGKDGHPCLVATSYMHGVYLGRLKVKFDKDGHVIKRSIKNNNPVLLDWKFTDDQQMLSVLEPFERKMDSLKQEVIAITGVHLDGDRESCRRKECNLGNLLTDALIYFYNKEHLENPNKDSGTGWTAPSIALWNAGCIRDFTAAAGQGLTQNDLYKIMQYENNVERFSIKGKYLREALEHSVSQVHLEKPSGVFLQVSGVHVIFDVTKSVGHRVRSIRVRCSTGNYEPLENEKIYKIATITYLAQGKDQYKMIEQKTIRRDTSDTFDIDAVMDYLKSHNPLIINEESRIQYDHGNGELMNYPKVKN